MNDLRRTALVGEEVELRPEKVALGEKDGLTPTPVILHPDPSGVTWTMHKQATGGMWDTKRNVEVHVALSGVRRARTHRVGPCEACNFIGVKLTLEAWAVFLPNVGPDAVLVDPRQAEQRSDS